MIGKSQVSAFQKFNQIENWLNIKKVISKNVYVPSFDSFDINSITGNCILMYFFLPF